VRGLSASLAVLVACSLALAAGCSPATAGGTGITSWAFAIGNHTLDGNAAAVGERYGPFDLVIVDGEEATRGEIAAIQTNGTTVLGYLSVGTIEKWRSWYPKLKPYRLAAWKDWKDEWYSDTSKRGFRRQIARNIAPDVLGKGFDGLMLDNTDMVETRSHIRQRRGMGRLIARLSKLIDGEGKLLYTQNGYPGIVHGYPNQNVSPLGQYFDGWNREDVSWTYDFDHRRYKALGPGAVHEAQSELEDVADSLSIPVFSTDYTANGDDQATADAINKSCAAGAVPYVSDIGLTLHRVPSPPYSCAP
jgi:endo-alpha-1,4-polygalactosaminidase (GH114 family)